MNDRDGFRSKTWLFIFALLGSSLAGAQPVSTASNPTISPALAGLYRIETPSTISPATITFLRLLPDGRNRVESLRIDAASASVRGVVTVGAFSKRPWRLKTVAPGMSRHICFEISREESCFAFHVEMPRGDVLLFGPDALWQQPTLILRREPKKG